MYTILFSNNVKFKGGQPDNSKWNDIPKYPIKRLIYNYKGYKVILKGYKEYCHVVKRGRFLAGNRFEGILQVILMARVEKESYLFIWDLIKNEFYTGVTKIDKEYNGGKVLGWKEGLKDSFSTYQIVKYK